MPHPTTPPSRPRPVGPGPAPGPGARVRTPLLAALVAGLVLLDVVTGGRWLSRATAAEPAGAAPPPIVRGTATVAAASDLVFCLDDLVQAFNQLQPQARIQAVTGSSGTFFAQIQRGAPFDLFLSADLGYAQALVTNGLADAGSLQPYAVGRLVIWSVRPDLLEPRPPSGTTATAHVWAALGARSIRRVALANPAHAPYGRAAREALQHAGLWDTLQPKLVLGENISQAAQFVQSGNAEVGLVALSLVSAPRLRDRGTWWLVPETAHAPLVQGLVLTTRGSTNAVARHFARHLTSATGRAIFARHGFESPAEPRGAAPAGKENRP